MQCRTNRFVGGTQFIPGYGTKRVPCQAKEIGDSKASRWVDWRDLENKSQDPPVGFDVGRKCLQTRRNLGAVISEMSVMFKI